MYSVRLILLCLMPLTGQYKTAAAAATAVAAAAAAVA